MSQYLNERGKPIPELNSLEELSTHIEKRYAHLGGSHGMYTLKKRPRLVCYWTQKGFKLTENFYVKNVRYKSRGAALSDWYFIHSQSHCPKDVTIKIFTYPGSYRVATIQVCEECRDFYEPTEINEQ